MHVLYKRPADVEYPHTIQPGPGNQLGYMLRMCCPKAFAKYRSV